MKKNIKTQGKRNDLNKWLKHVKRGYKKRMKTRIKIQETKCMGNSEKSS